MTAEYQLLIDALCVAVAERKKDLQLQVDWPVFFRLTDAHNLTALVCDGIQKTPGAWEQVPKAGQEYLYAAYMKAVFRDSQMEHTQQLLQQALQQARVEHIFLKGMVLKHDYPVPALRTMSDMDLLVYARDFEKLDQVAKKLEGRAVGGDGNHRNYVFPGPVAVEFHPNLVHHASLIGTGMNPGWQYARQTDKPYVLEMSEEGFYLNTICHLAHHFVNGGVGVRFVLDVWVHEHLRKQPMDMAFVEKELERFGLLDFSRKIRQLARCWFADGERTELMEELGEYILTSGSHGTAERAVLNAVSLSPGGNRRSAMWSKVFYPRAELEDRFPWCKGKAWLLPAAWCARAFKAVTTHGHIIRKWKRDSDAVTDAAAADQQEKLARFGIHRKKKTTPVDKENTQ